MHHNVQSQKLMLRVHRYCVITLIIPMISSIYLSLFYILPLKRGELGRLIFAGGLPLLQVATGWLPRHSVHLWRGCSGTCCHTSS